MKKVLSIFVSTVIFFIPLFNVNASATESSKTVSLLSDINSSNNVSVSLKVNDKVLGLIPSSQKLTFMYKEDKLAIEIYNGLLRYKAIVNSGIVYNYYPDFPFVYTKKAMYDTYIPDILGLIYAATDLPISIPTYCEEYKSYQETINNTEYYVEEFSDNEIYSYKYYYQSDELKMIEVNNSQDSSVNKIFEIDISFSVDDGEFVIPSTAIIDITLLAFLF